MNVTGEYGVAEASWPTAVVTSWDHCVQRRTATTLTQLQTVLDDWVSLRNGHGLLTPETDPDRYSATVAAMGAEVGPHVIICRADGEPCGAVIGRIARRRRVFRLGYLPVPGPNLRTLEVVYGGLIANHTPVARDAILDYLSEVLSRGDVDLIDIHHLPVDHPLYEPIVHRFMPQQQIEAHWRFTLVPGSYEKTLQSLSGKHRANVRRKERALVAHFQGDVSLKVFRSPDDIEEFIRSTAALAAETYQAGMGATFCDNTLWREILKTNVAKGRFLGYWLVCAGRPIAFQVGAVYEGTFHEDFRGYLPTYRHLSAGTVLHHRALEHLCSLGLIGLDCGFGDAEYKREYGSTGWEEGTLRIYGSSARARYAKAIEGLTRNLHHAAACCLSGLGLLGWVKRAWRGRLTSRR